MKILIIAPVPPPITGQSLAVSVFKDAIEKKNEVVLVNLAKNSFSAGINSLGRVLAIFRIWKEVWRKHKGVDRIYFTTSESVFGNFKDLFIYLICFRQLSSMFIHMHGGEGMKNILAPESWLGRLNGFFLKRLKGVIVLGKTHMPIFMPYVPAKRIFVVPNFALDEYFIPEEELIAKFSALQPLKVLFLSNLVHGKGYDELLAAYKLLSPDLQSKIQLDFAGGCNSDEERTSFSNAIKNFPLVRYHGIVKGAEKRNLLARSHIFCLPTYFPYEGQPISILEAYASGCCVLTTNHSGIFDIFTPNKNGFEVDKRSPESIVACLKYLVENLDIIEHIGRENTKFAQAHFRLDTHLRNMENVIIGEVLH